MTFLIYPLFSNPLYMHHIAKLLDKTPGRYFHHPVLRKCHYKAYIKT